ncbi:U-box domain-containing protein 4-like [Prosopis cineraria]|uniref:U-box domain-containing protein 4-like n=1 Tax=Prosopis cineraria TaxID=364024 RepID=UPI00240EC547|nr:U-box domain-containing protein 4-like [Prosopis cineraria]
MLSNLTEELSIASSSQSPIAVHSSSQRRLMGTESPVNFTYMGRSVSESSIDDHSSSAFSDCNSDRSGEFPTASSQSRNLLIACASDNSDDFIARLVNDLQSSSIEDQKQAAMEIRLLAKNKPENRLKIAEAGAIKPLISLMSSPDLQLQEYGVTTILNLSLCDENKELIVSSGAIKPLVRALNTGTSTAKENAACALLRLSHVEQNKVVIGRSGAIPLLVKLLESGSFRGKKDASTALYSLCSVKDNKIRAVQAGIMKPLVELMADFGSNMVDKSAYVLSVLVSVLEARAALVEEGGIPVLVEILEVGSQRQKQISAVILSQICEDNAAYRTMVAREGAIPPLVALSQSGAGSSKHKAETLIELLRQPRPGNAAISAPGVSA